MILRGSGSGCVCVCGCGCGCPNGVAGKSACGLARRSFVCRSSPIPSTVFFFFFFSSPTTSFILVVDAAPERQPGSGSTLYECISVVNHTGDVHWGHYTADCLDRDTQAWHSFNDSRVSSTSVDRLSAANAYLLFYARKKSSV